MRLVVEAAIEGQLRPGHLDAGVQQLHSPLKTLDAAPHLGRETDLFAEDLRKSPLAPARAESHIAHRGDGRRAPEPAERELDDPVPREMRGESPDQKLLEAGKPFLGR